MIFIGTVIDNRTLCDEFGVGNMGGIRVNNRRSLIVLVSNNTDPTYRNVWRDGSTLPLWRSAVGAASNGVGLASDQRTTSVVGKGTAVLPRY
jgi:hypothetical protein